MGKEKKNTKSVSNTQEMNSGSAENVNTNSANSATDHDKRAYISKDEMEKMVKDAVEAAIHQFSTSFTSMMNQKLTQIEQKIESLTMTLDVSSDQWRKSETDLKKRCERAESAIQDITTRCKRMESAQNDLEQYGRRNNLLFRGLPSKKGETCEQTVCTFINNSLSVVDLNKKRIQVAVSDLDIAHPLKTPDGQPPLMIAKFTHRTTKMAVIKARKQLKGKTIALSDDLTHKNNQLLTKLRSNPNIEQAWTWEGKIFAIVPGEERPKTFTLKDPLPSEN